MRTKSTKQKLSGWAICVTYSDGTYGWMIGSDLDVEVFQSQNDAEKALKQMKRNQKYSWNADFSVKEFNGFSCKKGQ